MRSVSVGATAVKCWRDRSVNHAAAIVASRIRRCDDAGSSRCPKRRQPTVSADETASQSRSMGASSVSRAQP